MASILIKNALVYDGSGSPGFKADILIKDQRIAGVGNFSQRVADKIIDALGAAVTPGFIDINTDSDHYLGLFSDPYQHDFIKQGVTTILGGNCGSSLAPLITGSLNSIRKWADINQVNVDWQTMAEFLEVLRRHGLGVNFGTLVGHSTIRRGLVGESFRNLTSDEIISFKKILEAAFQEGAFGFSTGLGYAHSRFVPYNEIKSLVEVTARHKRVYATHLRSESNGLLAALNETLSLAKDTGVKTQISHFRPINGFKADYEKALVMIEENAATANVNFDLYPFDTSVAPIYTLLPEWAQQGGLEVMTDNISAPEVREKLIEELPNVKGDELVIARTLPAYKFLAGKTLGEFAATRNLKMKEALLELMQLTDLRAVLFYKNINFESVLKFLSVPRAFVSSNGASLPDDHFKHERYYDTFPKFLRLVKEKELMSFELAISKITSAPARKYGIKDRGLIVEGYYADLAIIRDNAPVTVILNGAVAMEEGKIEKSLSGQILKA